MIVLDENSTIIRMMNYLFDLRSYYTQEELTEDIEALDELVIEIIGNVK